MKTVISTPDTAGTDQMDVDSFNSSEGLAAIFKEEPEQKLLFQECRQFEPLTVIG